MADALRTRLRLELSREEAHAHYIKATGKGIRKVMSKMGRLRPISPYCGAQIFDAVGLAQVDSYFSGTATTTAGISLKCGRRNRRHDASWCGSGSAVLRLCGGNMPCAYRKTRINAPSARCNTVRGDKTATNIVNMPA